MYNKIRYFSEKFGLFFIVLISIIFFFILSFRKNGFFVDELFSLGHANSTVGAFLIPEVDSNFEKNAGKLDEIWFDREHLMKYLTVQKGEGFNYKNIYQNLEKDVHPPLYLMILHTVSSMFHDSFNKWIGLSINLVVLICLILSFYRLAFFCYKEKNKALMATLFFVFMPAVVEMESFIRMYLLQMLLFVNVMYYSLRCLDDEKLDIWNLIKLFLFMTLALLTHFYSYVYGFFLTLGVSVVFLRRKQYRNLIIYDCIMLLAVLLSFVIFPPAIDMLFGSSRGEEAVQSFSLIQLEYLPFRMEYFLKYFFDGIIFFADKIYWLILLIIVGGIGFVLRQKKVEKLDVKFIVLLAVSILSATIILLASPSGRSSVRYYFVSNVLFFIVMMECYYKYFGVKVFSRWLCLLCFAFLLIANIWGGMSNFYLMRDTDFSKLENVVKEKRVLLISDWFLFNFEMLDKLAEAKESYKISPYQFDKVDKFLVSDELKAGDVVVSFAGVGKDVGNKKILEGEKYRLKYKDLIFYGWKSYEVYERY